MAAAEFPANDQFWANPYVVDIAEDLGFLAATYERPLGEVIRTCESFLHDAPVLARLDDVAPGTMLAIDAEARDPNGTMETWFFFKMPYPPEPGSGESQWMITDRDWSQPALSHAVHMRGAFVPVPVDGSGPVTVEDKTVRHNVGFMFYETATFRSSEDAPPGLLTRSLPPPEYLDPGYFEMNRHIGQIVTIDGVFYWRMPSTVYGTGRVQNIWTKPVGTIL